MHWNTHGAVRDWQKNSNRNLVILKKVGLSFPKILNIMKFWKKNLLFVPSMCCYFSTCKLQTGKKKKNYLIRVKTWNNWAKHYFWANFTIFQVFFQLKIALEPLNTFRNILYFIKIHTISYKIMSHLSHLCHFEILAFRITHFHGPVHTCTSCECEVNVDATSFAMNICSSSTLLH